MTKPFTVEESAALLRYIWPHWPDLRGMRRPPDDLDAWLAEFRRQHSPERNQP